MEEKKCFLCGSYRNLECHHIFGGANRKLSEQYGLKVMLCHNCHNEPPFGVHFDHEKMVYLRQLGQKKAMAENNWSIDDFRSVFGKNYLD